MHYTGTIWRPPYEAKALLLEVTAGCTHHKCKFCTLYDDLPFKFKMSPPEDIEADLQEAMEYYKLLGGRKVTRTFLTGANPFVLSSEKLLEISRLISIYFPENKTIGCFSRITDITSKSDEELKRLKISGYDSLTIGIETADDEALSFMNKGYSAKDILEQCKRLDYAGISYNFFYLAGISGFGNGQKGAGTTADICNKLHPKLIGANMLTIYPNSQLYKELKSGNWTEESELEKYKELRVLVESLSIPVKFAALGASNAVQINGCLPKDKKNILNTLNKIINSISEEDLRLYRENLPHL